MGVTLGQWVGHPTLEPQISTSIMLDDSDSGFEKGCQSTPCTYWHYVTGVGTNGGMWWTNINYEDDYWARWRPTLLLPGFYEVYVFIPNDNATSWQVNYMISHPNGTQSTVVDQQGTSDQWLCLGLYYFDAGSSPFGAISVSDYTGETNLNLKLGIDAVQFRLRSPIFLPLILKNYN